MSQNIVLIFLKIFYKIYSGIIPDFFSNNLIEIITIIDPVFFFVFSYHTMSFLAALISMRLYGLHRSEPQTASSDKKIAPELHSPDATQNAYGKILETKNYIVLMLV